jgi:hypothetical protein
MVTLLEAAMPAVAGEHTWRISEVFSNADGSIQFIEMKESAGTSGETGIQGNTITSATNARTFTIPSPALTGPTTNKYVLFATPGFAALPGAPTPNYTLPDVGMVVGNFLSISGDTIKFNPHDSPGLVFGVANPLPTDGINSRHRTVFTGSTSVVGPNSPTNYAGQTGSVNLAGLPGVPDGGPGSTPMTVESLDALGTMLQISWDTSSCSGTKPHKIIYGEKSNLPVAPGGTFSLAGAVCGIGTTSPYVWSSVPDSFDGAGLIWWLILVDDPGGKEGSWGEGSDELERDGPGTNGASDQCGGTTKELTNACGH